MGDRQRRLASILVTGGAGFIGSNFVRFLFSQPDFTGRIVTIDKLTYSGNLENLADVQKAFEGSRHVFINQDICDEARLAEVFREYDIDAVVHFAAESHVDRSILNPRSFLSANVEGTFTVLEVARSCWAQREDVIFHHVSTDEVYGSSASAQGFSEESRYNPQSPYAATKAASDHLVAAYGNTYGLPSTISHASNNYGPYQFPEKLIPLMITAMEEGKELPVYGDGRNVRDWIYVDDHCRGIWTVLNRGRAGATYNIGGTNQWENLQLVEMLCESVALAQGLPRDHFKPRIRFVKDRPGHDRRYALDCRRIKAELGWGPIVDLEEGIQKTVSWYLSHREWVDRIKSGEYRDWYSRNYEKRSSTY
jgi:dTDP-glucose 4,6-dehydratase